MRTFNAADQMFEDEDLCETTLEFDERFNNFARSTVETAQDLYVGLRTDLEAEYLKYGLVRSGTVFISTPSPSLLKPNMQDKNLEKATAEDIVNEVLANVKTKINGDDQVQSTIKTDDIGCTEMRSKQVLPEIQSAIRDISDRLDAICIISPPLAPQAIQQPTTVSTCRENVEIKEWRFSAENTPICSPLLSPDKTYESYSNINIKTRTPVEATADPPDSKELDIPVGAKREKRSNSWYVVDVDDQPATPGLGKDVSSQGSNNNKTNPPADQNSTQTKENVLKREITWLENELESHRDTVTEPNVELGNSDRQQRSLEKELHRCRSSCAGIKFQGSLGDEKSQITSLCKRKEKNKQKKPFSQVCVLL